jgi:Transcription factor WhiB
VKPRLKQRFVEPDLLAGLGGLMRGEGWKRRAACLGSKANFFPESAAPTAAKAVCETCEVRDECLARDQARHQTRGLGRSHRSRTQEGLYGVKPDPQFRATSAGARSGSA